MNRCGRAPEVGLGVIEAASGIAPASNDVARLLLLVSCRWLRGG